jgi:hypothetical protein
VLYNVDTGYTQQDNQDLNELLETMEVPLQTSASTSQQEPRVGAGEGSSRGKGIATEESEALRNVELAYETDDSDSSVEIEIERRRPRTEEQDDPTYVLEDAPSSKLARTGSGKVFSRLQAEHLRQQASGSGAEEVPTSSTAAAVEEVPVSSPATSMPITEASTQVCFFKPLFKFYHRNFIDDKR